MGIHLTRRERKVLIVGSLAVLVAIVTYGLLASTGTFDNDIWDLSGAIVGFLAALYGLNKVYGPAEDNEKLLTTDGVVGSEVTLVPESHAEGSIGTELGNYHAAAKKIEELLKSESSGRHSLKFLAITGRSTMTNYLDKLIKEYKGPLDIELQVVDPMSPYVKVMPPHWGGEATSTVQEITRLYKVRPYPGTLKVWKYEYLPCIIGDIINEDHLILSFFGWDHQTEKLGDSKEHYFYYNRNSKTKKVFELFQSWFDHAPKSPWETNAKTS